MYIIKGVNSAILEIIIMLSTQTQNSEINTKNKNSKIYKALTQIKSILLTIDLENKRINKDLKKIYV